MELLHETGHPHQIVSVNTKTAIRNACYVSDDCFVVVISCSVSARLVRLTIVSFRFSLSLMFPSYTIRFDNGSMTRNVIPPFPAGSRVD